MDFARLHSQEAEQSVLGSLLLDCSVADRIGALKPEHFFDRINGDIFRQIKSMVASGDPVDVITVAEALETTGTTDVLPYLGDLVQNTPTSKNAHRYAETVIGKAMERQLLAASDTIKGIVSGAGKTRDKLMQSQSAVMAITEAVATKEPRHIREALSAAVETLEKRSEGHTQANSTGFHELDRALCGGLRNGNLVVIAGRPGMGKTTLAVNIAKAFAKNEIPASVFSMEMSEQELTDRLIAQVGAVPMSAVLAGDMAGDNGDRIMGAVSRLMNLPIIIDDQGGLSLFDVANKARSIKRKHGLGLIVVDYLQLMVGDGDNRNDQISAISRGLKALAKELNVPVIALSQLSRKCEERTNKRPIPSDLRESGAIEQDADVILFVYQDEKYNPTSPDKGTAEIIIGKARQGATGMVRLGYQGHFTRFVDLAHGWQPEQVEQTRRKRGFGDD